MHGATFGYNNIAMKSILVPCDFSKQSINAFRFALDVARRSKGIIHVLHVIEIPVLHDSVLMPALSFEEVLFKELGEKARSAFKKLLEKHTQPGDTVRTHVAFGAPAPLITREVIDRSIDVIIMGTTGAGTLKALTVGSNAEKVVRNATVPVITMNGFHKFSSVSSIVLANTLDTDHQEDFVMKVKALQYFFKAHLHVLWVNTPRYFERTVATERRLQAFAKRFLLRDFSLHVVNDVYEEDGIVDFARSVKADMIAMGTHSRKGLAHVVTGSVAEDVVNRVAMPVWTYTLQNE